MFANDIVTLTVSVEATKSMFANDIVTLTVSVEATKSMFAKEGEIMKIQSSN